MELLDGFQLDDDLSIDEQIEFEPGTHPNTLVLEGNAIAAFSRKPCASEFDEQTISINRFKQARAQNSMDLNRAAYDPLSKIVQNSVRNAHAHAESTNQTTQQEIRRSGGSHRSLRDQEFTFCDRLGFPHIAGIASRGERVRNSVCGA